MALLSFLHFTETRLGGILSFKSYQRGRKVPIATTSNIEPRQSTENSEACEQESFNPPFTSTQINPPRATTVSRDALRVVPEIETQDVDLITESSSSETQNDASFQEESTNYVPPTAPTT